MTAIAAPGRVVANMFAKGTAFAVEKGAQLAMVVVAGARSATKVFGRFAFASSLAVVLAFATDLGLTIWTTRALARNPETSGPVLGTGLRLRLGRVAAGHARRSAAWPWPSTIARSRWRCWRSAWRRWRGASATTRAPCSARTSGSATRES